MESILILFRTEVRQLLDGARPLVERDGRSDLEIVIEEILQDKITIEWLGSEGEATPALRDMVNDINIKRRAVYTQRARSNQATLEAYATTAGCQAIMRTVPGEKYQAPDGTWRTRTSAPPERLSICP